MAGQTQAEIRKKLELKSEALAANIASLSHLDGARAQIDAVLEELRELTVQQASFTAQKQEASKRLMEVLSLGGNLMAFVNAGIRQHYGNRSEKLVEFGLRPFRGRPRRSTGATPPKPPLAEISIPPTAE